MTWLEELQKVATVLHEAGKIEQYNQILKAQGELLSLQNKVALLEGENSELREKLKFSESLNYKPHAYWTDKEDGPFCSRCWDKDRIGIRMHLTSGSWGECPECKVQADVYESLREFKIPV